MESRYTNEESRLPADSPKYTLIQLDATTYGICVERCLQEMKFVYTAVAPLSDSLANWDVVRKT
jgi:hypothetical protein